MSEPARAGGLRLEGVSRSFSQGKAVLEVLKGADLAIRPGEIVALVGPSGAGKSTLLHIAGLLERPDEGEVWLAGEPCGKLSDDRRTGLRRTLRGLRGDAKSGKSQRSREGYYFWGGGEVRRAGKDHESQCTAWSGEV